MSADPTPPPARDLPPEGAIETRDGLNWYRIERVDRLRPFLMSLTSDQNHWMFVASNGALTAGRRNPDHALFPYYTQDKLVDLAAVSGSLTCLRFADGELWRPFDPLAAGGRAHRRVLRKSELGHCVEFEETHPRGLRWTASWRPSRRFGFVRRVTLTHLGGGDTMEVEVLDGLRNILPAGLAENFQHRYSILGDAYKTATLGPLGQVAAFALSALPSDGTLPMEALLANVAWHRGLEGATLRLDEQAVEAFWRGEEPVAAHARRGVRPAYLLRSRVRLAAEQTLAWYLCADVDVDLGGAMELERALARGDVSAEVIEADCQRTVARLRGLVAAADGLSATADRAMGMRHLSNTLFNLMRGGRFATGETYPEGDLVRHVARFNAAAALEVDAWERRRGAFGRQRVRQLPPGELGPHAERLVREYLPLTFSRRHGDPSRPWNRFSIEVEDEAGRPLYNYQGNWRDIFQNWEALLHSYPAYLDAAVRRFLNASTADGYNPYRITKQGVDWEAPDPHDPWSNLGYWGDHQIIYLLRLLEAWERFFPGQIGASLADRGFVYLEIPYRLHPFRQMVEDPRETITYDHAAAAAIARRVQAQGEDGKLLQDPAGGPVVVSLLEKLLVPLLAKLSNFVPGGGIWMNTQRPEWNDANNALVGYGVSVVTAGYLLRYVAFLERLLEANGAGGPWEVTAAVARLLETQQQVLAESSAEPQALERQAIMTVLGTSASAYRASLYEGDFAGQTALLNPRDLRRYLAAARRHLEATLRSCRRGDGLYESYQLLAFGPEGVRLRQLYPMLEGQVSVLCSGLLTPAETVEVLRALAASPLYRPDQQSYLLYPNRELATFWQKNHLPPAALGELPWLVREVQQGRSRLLRRLPDGHWAFPPEFVNGKAVEAAARADGVDWAPHQIKAIVECYEEVFRHHEFTGRSGTFFAYEGLGSVYWHMVSKLVLATAETLLEEGLRGAADTTAALREHFRQLKEGLGMHKPVAVHGAIPTDAYSHTPESAGAQQPGMTGQVKEDWLWRMLELGLSVRAGRIAFHDVFAAGTAETLERPLEWEFPALDGTIRRVAVPAGAVAFSFCQVPIVRVRAAGGEDEIVVRRALGEEARHAGRELPAEVSRAIFERTGEVVELRVRLRQP